MAVTGSRMRRICHVGPASLKQLRLTEPTPGVDMTHLWHAQVVPAASPEDTLLSGAIAKGKTASWVSSVWQPQCVCLPSGRLCLFWQNPRMGLSHESQEWKAALATLQFQDCAIRSPACPGADGDTGGRQDQPRPAPLHYTPRPPRRAGARGAAALRAAACLCSQGVLGLVRSRCRTGAYAGAGVGATAPRLRLRPTCAASAQARWRMPWRRPLSAGTWSPRRGQGCGHPGAFSRTPPRSSARC
jgi:hypothetical protein